MIDQASLVPVDTSAVILQQLTTILTTTIPDSTPLRAILHIDPCQVSHGIPQSGQIWHARGPEFESP
jgi:hypothetical protein